MKEATGELNMTVVTVVAIAAIGAFFYAFIWPSIKNSITSSVNCNQANCDQSSCTTSNGKTTCSSCSVTDETGATTWSGQCTFTD